MGELLMAQHKQLTMRQGYAVCNPYRRVGGPHPLVDPRNSFRPQAPAVACSPVARSAIGRAVLPCREEEPTPLQVFAEGGYRADHAIADPTFQVLEQPHPIVDITDRWQPPSSTFTEYIGTGKSCTASESLCRYVRTRDYQKGKGRSAPNQYWQPIMSYLSAGAAIDHQDVDYNGFTALHHAAATGRAELIHFLIAQGANVDQRDYDANKAVDIAQMSQHLDCMHILSQAKQVKNRISRYNDMGYLEYPMNPMTSSHSGVPALTR